MCEKHAVKESETRFLTAALLRTFKYANIQFELPRGWCSIQQFPILFNHGFFFPNKLSIDHTQESSAPSTFPVILYKIQYMLTCKAGNVPDTVG